MTDSNEKSTDTPLAPWAHPRAQQWFEQLFEQSGLVMRLRDAVENTEQPISADEARLLMVIVTVLGREGIWPSNQRSELQRLTMKLGRLAKKTESENGTKPLSLDEHRRRKAIAEEVELELEFLRRISGISKRVSEINTPKSWGKFWT